MKMILEFNEEEKDVANLALNVVGFWSEVFELQQDIRTKLKYEEGTMDLEEAYKRLGAILNEYSLS